MPLFVWAGMLMDILIKLVLTIERDTIRKMQCSHCFGEARSVYLQTKREENMCYTCSKPLCLAHDIIQGCMSEGCANVFCIHCVRYGYIRSCKECDLFCCNVKEHDGWSCCKLCGNSVCPRDAEKHYSICSFR